MAQQRLETGLAGAGVTAVSAPCGARTGRTAASGVHRPSALVARLSLCFVGMPSAVGCFDAPPQYSEPDRVPPVIVVNQVFPPPTSLYVPVGMSAEFDAPFRADDAGQPMVACFVSDIEISAPGFVVESHQLASDSRPFADQTPRYDAKTTWNWTRDVAPGCHTLTAIIADQSNFYVGRCNTRNDLMEARVTWFVWLGQSQSDSTPDIKCFVPQGAGVTP